MYKHKKRKIIFITLFYPYTHNGVSYDFYVSEEIQRLSENFDEVDVISLSTGHDGQLPVPHNVSVQNLDIPRRWADRIALIKALGKKTFWKEFTDLKELYGININQSIFKAISVYAARAIRYYTELKKIVSNTNFEEYDIWIYSYWNFEYALASVLLKNKYTVKTVVRTHSLDLYFDRMPEKYQPFKQATYKGAVLFVFISEQGRNYFYEKHKIAFPEQAKGMLNRIGTRNGQEPYLRNYDKIVLLSNAWIQPLKRVDLLVRALSLLDDVPVEWIHVGDDYGTGRMPALLQLADDLLGNKTHIRYEFAGRKSNEALYEIYRNRQVNLFINLSTTEGTPVSMMEALSFGVPIIGTAVGGVPEIIQDGVNGFLLPANIGAPEVAAKIREYFLLPVEKREQLSASARQTWNEKYNAQTNSKILVEKMLSL